MTERSKPYLAWIRRLPCLCCLGPSEPHHCNPKGHGGEALKASDYRCIPLCRKHHTEAHSLGKETFARRYGIDYEKVIDKLNRIYRERR